MTEKKHTPFYRKKLFTSLVIIIVLIAGLLLWSRLSPVLGATIIRVVFDKGALNTRTGMEKVVGAIPDVHVESDINYIDGDTDALLDIYTPDSALTSTTGLPIVVWTHGGAWLSGDKTDTVPYFKKLAKAGYIVVAPNYTLAPSKTYPTQVKQLNQAYGYINKNASRFHGDRTKIILAGDSAGAQLSAQLATIITNPAYAKEMNITPALTTSQIAGMVLYCGIYKMEMLAEPDATLSKILSWGNRITVWSYTGTRDTKNPLIKQMSPYYHANSHFPATFISGGNGDSLTDVQSKPFAEHLQSLNVNVTTQFYADNHVPRHAHENQFVLDKDGLANFDAMTDFLKRKTN